MFIAFIVVTIAAAAANIYAALVDFIRADFIVDNMTKYGIPHSWLFPLGALKAAGALGLLVGIALPPIGVAAAASLVLYYIGAVITVIRVRCYSHIRFPAPFLLLAGGSLVLLTATL